MSTDKKVTWRTTNTPFVQGKVEGVVVLELTKAIKINHISVSLRFNGVTQWIQGFHQTKQHITTSHGSVIPFETSQRIDGVSGSLAAGRHEFPVSIDMPEGIDVASFIKVQGTFISETAGGRTRKPTVEALWEISVHADVPWAVDVRERFRLFVTPRTFDFQSGLFETKVLKPMQGGHADAFEMSGTIPKRVYYPGETMTFDLKIKNLGKKAFPHVRASLAVSFPHLQGKNEDYDEWTSELAHDFHPALSFALPNSGAPTGEDVVGKFSWIVPTYPLGFSQDNSLFTAKFFVRITIVAAWTGAAVADAPNPLAASVDSFYKPEHVTQPTMQAKITLAPESMVKEFEEHCGPNATKAAPVIEAESASAAAAAAAAAGPRNRLKRVGASALPRTSTTAAATPKPTKMVAYKTQMGFKNVPKAPPPKITRFTVTIVRALNLKGVDAGGTSDPFVVLKVGSNEFKTEVIKKNCNPQFDEIFKVDNPDMSEPLQFAVFDWNRAHKSELLAEQSIDVSFIQPGLTPIIVDLGQDATLEIVINATTA